MTFPCKLIAFDLDGTLYLGEQAVPGAIDLVQDIRRRARVVFFTNNSTKTPRQIFEKLCRLQIECAPEEIYTSSFATISYLQEQALNRIFLVGSSDFHEEMTNYGITLVDNESAEHVVVGLDSGFTYQKIAIALSIILRGGRFIACNEDASFPVEGKKVMPGCGAMVGAIAAAVGRRPDFIVGKPHVYMLAKISREHGVQPDELMVVGDSLTSDMAMAREFRSPGVLIGGPLVIDPGIRQFKNLEEFQEYLRRNE